MIVTKTDAIYNVIKTCYKEDSNLVDIYHVKAGMGLDYCVKYNTNDLKSVRAECYMITSNDELVGIYATSVMSQLPYLSFMFIRPKFRKEFTDLVWDKIKVTFNKPFVTAIYKKNIPACKFFDKKCDNKFMSYEEINNELFYFYQFELE
jgi:hypothetical protein